MTYKQFFNRYLLSNQHRFSGKTIVDLPAGDGETSRVLFDMGSKVIPFDLFPEYFKAPDLKCQRVNIKDGIPLPNDFADFVICQEGIEHFSDQLFAFREFNRVLKNEGRLILTTPNYSNLRSKVSYLLGETERFGSTMPPNELDSVWMSENEIVKEMYYGHIFLIGIQKLRVLSRLAGFNIASINREFIKPTSAILFPFLYPLILINSIWTYYRNVKKKTAIPLKIKRKIYGEVFKLSINPKPLVYGSLFVEFIKEKSLENIHEDIYSTFKDFESPT